LTGQQGHVTISAMEMRPVPSASGRPYQEFLRSPYLSVGVYRLQPGATDLQEPHTEDELYYVMAGRGRFTADERTVDVEAGTCLFIPALERHRFHDITETLEVLVVFGPSEGSRLQSWQ
jgi:mannose-6-phosphate isomerase-like protein (cupin superfamily)